MGEIPKITDRDVKDFLSQEKALQRKRLVRVHELAVHLGLGPRRVQALAKNGVLPKVKRGVFDIDMCRMAYIRHLRDQIAYYSGGESSGNILGGSQ